MKKTTACLPEIDIVMYYEGKLPKSKKDMVEKHLSICNKCFKEYTDYFNILKKIDEIKKGEYISLPQKKFEKAIKTIKDKISKKRESILISCLGLAPAVITEMLVALKSKKINIDKVLAIATADRRILNECYTILKESIKRNFPEIEFDLIYIPATDIKTKEDNFEFMILSAKTVLHYKSLGYKVYLSLAGGRKTMSNIIGTIAQFFGADGLYHILVPDEFEKEGRIEYFKGLSPDEIDKKLYPEKFELVEIPFVGISSLIEVLKKIASDKKVPKSVKDLLLENYLIEKEKGEIKLSKKGKEIIKIIKELEKYPDLSLLSSSEKIDEEKLSELKISEVKDYLNYLKFSPYINYVDFETRTMAKSDITQLQDLKAGKEGFIEWILKTNGDILYINIDTTAQNLSQAQIVKKYFKKIFH